MNALHSTSPGASNAHTLGLLATILTFALTGRLLVGNQTAQTLEEFGRIPIYCAALASMWCLFASCADSAQGRA